MPTIDGTTGLDRLTGTADADVINGRAGQDYIQGLGGDDIIDGGDEPDNPNQGIRDGDLIDGGDGNDLISGAGGNDVIVGGRGSDTITGGSGYNIISHYGPMTVRDVPVSPQTPGGFTYRFDPYADDFAVDNLFGGAMSDVIFVGLGDNADGGGGSRDLLWVSLAGMTQGVNAFLDSANWLAGLQSLTGGILTDFEWFSIRGTDFDDTLFSFGQTTVGGDGADTITIQNFGDDRTVITSTWSHAETVNGVLGSRLDDGKVDIVTGGDGRETVFMGLGDRFDGRGGSDIVHVTLYGLTAGVNLALNGDWQAVLGQAIGGAITNAELLRGLHLTRFDDIVVAPVLVSSLIAIEMRGFEGNDRLSGTTLADTLYGDEGDDHLIGGNANFLNAMDDILDGGAGDDILDGGYGLDRLIGGEGSDTAIFSGNRADFTIRTVGGVVTVTLGNEVDVLVNVEFIRFTDMTVSVVQPAPRAGVIVYGSSTFETLTGGAGDDTILAYANSDTVNAGAGADAVDGGEGSDTLNGEAGDDDLFGNIGDDIITGGAGNDTLDGGDGLDVAVFAGNRADYVITYNGAIGTITGPDGTDTFVNIERLRFADQTLVAGPRGGVILSGSSSAETLQGTERDDVINGGDGNDIIYAYGGSDTVIGGAGDDRVIVSGDFARSVASGGRAGEYQAHGRGSGIQGADVFDATAIQEVLTISRDNTPVNLIVNGHIVEGFSLLLAGAGDDVVNLRTSNTFGSGYGLIVDGGEGNDTLTSAYEDTLRGGAGNDLLEGYRTEGGAGNDILRMRNYADGGDGDDIVYVRPEYPAHVQAHGGEGRDTLHITGRQLTVDLQSGRTGDIHNAYLTATGFEDLILDAFNYWSDGTDFVARGDAGANSITVADTSYNTTQSRYELDGRDGDDILGGSRGVDKLIGGAGDDLLTGYGGDDTINGGDGVDTAVFSGSRTAYTFSTVNGVTTVTGPDGTDTLTGVERLRFSDGLFNINGQPLPVEINGTPNADILTGGGANDLISAGGGDDLITGGAGDDVVDGGAGFDTAVFATGAVPYTVTVNGGVVTVASSDGVDTLTNVERLRFGGLDLAVADLTGAALIGSAAGETLAGGSGDDRFFGLAGNDALNGGDGSDTADYSGAAGAVTARIDTQSASNDGDGGADAFTSIENLTGSAFDDLLVGDANANRLSGGLGRDVIIAGGGNDVLNGGAGQPNELYGGAGDDTYIVEERTDSIIENAGEGVDTVLSALFQINLSANVENLTYTGTGTFTGVGNAIGNIITGGTQRDVLLGLGGDDILIGGAGAANELYGGSGNDTYVLDVGDSIIEGVGDGIDTVQLRGLHAYNLGANVENGVVVGAGDYALNGNGMDNVLTGGAGDDTLQGGAGNDVLHGGQGIDTVTYILSTSGVNARLDINRGISDGLGGADTFTGIENLTGSNLADLLIGDAGNNVIDGAIGNDVLLGFDGDDTLIGGSGGGFNEMYGGRGDDLYIVDAGDTLIELAGEGVDTVQTTNGGFTLAANIENLTYRGPGNFAGVGNAEANVITGGAGNDTLAGRGGDDTLVGGLGDDLALLQGVRADYVITAVPGGWRVVDGVAGRDGTDTLIGVESVRFSDGAVLVLGTPGAMPQLSDKAAFDDAFILPALSDDDALVLPALATDKAFDADPLVLPDQDGGGFVFTLETDLGPIANDPHGLHVFDNGALRQADGHDWAL